MLLLRDQIIESYENPTSPTWEEIIGHMDAILHNHNNHIFSSPNIFPFCEVDSLLLEDTVIESHENIISPFPNAPTIWKDLFEWKDPIIGKHDNDSCSSLTTLPIGDEDNLKNSTMECDEHIFFFSNISPTRVDIMMQGNDRIEACISKNSNVASFDENDEVTLDSPSLINHENKDKSFEVMNIIYPLKQSPEPSLITYPPSQQPKNKNKNFPHPQTT
jgi:hypothetical protein